MKVRFRNLLLILLFVCGIFLPGTMTLIHQKRSKNPPIDFLADTLTIKHFPVVFTNYFNDSLYYRKPLIEKFYSFRIFVLREKFIDDKVLVGKDGWLFYAPDNDGYGISDFMGNIQLSEKELTKLTKNLEAQNNWLKRKGIQYLVVICPNKQTIYPEYLPCGFEKGKTTVLDQITERIKDSTDINFLDLRPVLLNEKKKNHLPLYFKTDTHWNKIGGYAGYLAIMERLNIKNANKNKYSIKTTEIEGRDICKMLGIKPAFKDQEVDLLFQAGQDALASTSKVVIFHDSYFDYFKNYFIPNFNTVVSRPHFWNSFDYKVIEDTKPDVVIFQMVERYSGAMLKDNPEILFKEPEIDSLPYK